MISHEDLIYYNDFFKKDVLVKLVKYHIREKSQYLMDSLCIRLIKRTRPRAELRIYKSETNYIVEVNSLNKTFEAFKYIYKKRELY